MNFDQAFHVTCPTCHKPYTFSVAKAALKCEKDGCVSCRNGHVVFYDRRNKEYYAICPKCGERKTSDTFEGARHKLYNKKIVGCNNCKGNLIAGANRKYTPEWLKKQGIFQNSDGEWGTKCPNGHEHTVKNLTYAIAISNDCKRCARCESIRRIDENLSSSVSKPNEEWVPVEDFKHYLISNYGRCLNTLTGKILNPQRVSQRRYLAYCLYDGMHFYKWKQVSRLVAGAFIPTDDYSKEVDHIDGDRENNHVSNLRWLNHRENIQDGRLKGRWKDYETGRLTLEQIKEIKLLPEEESNTELAKKYGVERTTICNIRNGKTWSNL